jgi:hypothetical protein
MARNVVSTFRFDALGGGFNADPFCRPLFAGASIGPNLVPLSGLMGSETDFNSGIGCAAFSLLAHQICPKRGAHFRFDGLRNGLQGGIGCAALSLLAHQICPKRGAHVSV